MGFIDTLRSEGNAVESIYLVLREQGCQIAARTYRSWKQTDRVVADRTVSGAMVIGTIRDLAWGSDDQWGDGGRRELTAEAPTAPGSPASPNGSLPGPTRPKGVGRGR